MNVSKVTSLANSFYKAAQMGSPSIRIVPSRPDVQTATELLKLWDSNYFVNVEEIRITPGPYGSVNSKEPNVINVDADRIAREAKGHSSGPSVVVAAAKEIAKAIAKSIADVTSHEKGHVDSWDPEKQEFKGGEQPAEAEAQKFEQWLEANKQRVEQFLANKSI